MSDVHMADVSEFQSSVDASAYLKAGFECIVVRTHNGYRPDHMMPERRDVLRRHEFVAIGWYQYLVHDRAPAAQAHDFVDGLGSLRPNEFVVCDCEEGQGSQVARVRAWQSVVDEWAGFPSTLYSGESFFDTNLGGASAWTGRPLWIAAYRSSEPSEPHVLWQHTDQFHFAGIAGFTDGNVHHGTAHEFLASVRGGPSAHASALAPPTPPEDAVQSPNPYMTADHRLGFVLATDQGEVKFIEQQNAPGSRDEQGRPRNSDFWKDEHAKAQWRSLGKP